jgi:hypothetical protein
MIGIYIFQLFEIIQNRSTAMLLTGIVLAGGTYLYQAFYKRRLTAILKENVFITAFVVQGLIWCMLSLLGLAGWFPLSGTYGVDLSYLPRQAYYLLFLPLISISALAEKDKFIPWAKEHNLECFAFLYVFYACINRTVLVEMDPVATLFFGALVLAGVPLLQNQNNYKFDGKAVGLRGWLQPVLLVLFLLLPNAGYGTSCTILMKALVAVLFLVRFRRLVLLGAGLCVPVLLAVSFVLPQIPNISAHISDRNTFFRIECWQDAQQTIADTFGLGIGYGTTYASSEFVHLQPIFHEDTNTWESVASAETTWGEYAENAEHGAAEQPYVTANHNSFVSVALRMGVLGVVLFAGILMWIWNRLRKEPSLSTAAVFLYCGSLLCITVNVGLESPGYFVPFLTAMCTVTNLTAKGQSQEAKA